MTRFAWFLALALVCVIAGCGARADTDCLGNSDCESNQCVGGRCIPLELADGGDTNDVLPEGDTPSGDVLDTSGEDPPSDPVFDPPSDPVLDPTDDQLSDPLSDPGLELQDDPAADPGADVAPTGPNACGGTAALVVNGQPALPQVSCGATGSGFLACNGVDALLCVGEPAPNACGGAGVLRATPGEACGCGGVWTCAGGAVVCAGGSDENACGGCATLPALPGYACRAADGTTGAWQCTSGDSLWCGAGNACGGTAPLPPVGRLPGQACDSACGPGVLVCNGTEAMQCRSTLPCNTCGGASSLAGNVGASCGVFGDGTWACEGRDRVRCEGATTPNACGGAEPLTAAPGDACGATRQYLCANGQLECVSVLPAEARNACGGDALLDHVPGSPCGECGAALWRCVGRNAVMCPVSDDVQRNECGGCGSLNGVVDTACGACGDGRFVCNVDGSALQCVGALLTRNSCGGCGILEASVGDDCGACGQYVCNDVSRRLVCEPRPLGSCSVTCDEIRGTCAAQLRDCIEAAGASDARCGACLPGYAEADGACASPVPAPTNVQASDGTSTAHVAVTWSSVVGATGYHVYRGATQVTTTPVAATSYNDANAPAGGVPPVVSGVSATTNRTGDVRVSWSAATPSVGATQSYTVVAVVGAQWSPPSLADTGYRAAQPIVRYEVEVRGSWTDGGTSTNYTDSAAPAGTLAVGSPTATTTRTDGVEVSVSAATTVAGEVQTYRIRAVNEAGAGGASSSATGGRSVGTATYQWQRATSSGGSYSNVSDATTTTYLDTGMNAGQERWYRVVVSAPGATDVTSTVVGGRRIAPATTLAQACSSDSACGSAEWCPTNTSERRCAPRPTVGTVQMPFQFVAAGAFTMGSPASEAGRFATELQTSVTLTHSFFVQRHELTQAHWTALSGGTNPSCFQSSTGTACTSTNLNPSGPVERVSWWSVLGYANELSTAEGLPACYILPASGCTGTWQAGNLSCGDAMPAVTSGNVYTCSGYRLLTEAEWEFTARAGTQSATYAGNLGASFADCSTLHPSLDGIAWWCRNAGDRTKPVGGRAPNAWGVYDILGNVWEWAWDRWDGTSTLVGGTDPRAEEVGSVRSYRGGSWLNHAQYSRAARRSSVAPGNQSNAIGVRLARTAPHDTEIDCGPLPAPLHGSVSTPNTRFRDVATYSCDAGYTIVGRTTRTCVATGDWVGEAPSCRLTAARLGDVCTTDSGCPAGAWCPTDTSHRRCSPRPVESGVEMPFQYAPAGSFTMGSPAGEVGRSTNEAQVSVTLTRAFFVQRTEVTQAQWRALSGGVNPACFQATTGTACSSANANPTGPVDQVTWWSVLGYANALSTSQGLAACYTLPSSGCTGTWQAGTLACGNNTMPAITAANVYACAGYRLPTEAEWEYAARAGTTTATYVGNLSGVATDCATAQTNLDGIAWWCRNASSRTHPVGSKTANAWGLYDVLGNVFEWTWDRWENGTNLVGGTDPRSESDGGDRAYRGGSWSMTAQGVRAAFRRGFGPGNQEPNFGVRLARTVP